VSERRERIMSTATGVAIIEPVIATNSEPIL
jgi:hypothetical protein